MKKENIIINIIKRLAVEAAHITVISTIGSIFWWGGTTNAKISALEENNSSLESRISIIESNYVSTPNLYLVISLISSNENKVCSLNSENS